MTVPLCMQNSMHTIQKTKGSQENSVSFLIFYNTSKKISVEVNKIQKNIYQQQINLCAWKKRAFGERNFQ